jgi:single-strand DNA-binding protein
MINRVVLVGRLTKDPELKYTQTGIAVTRFTLAVNRAFQSASGEKEADFISCVAWRKQAENIANFLRKGSLVGVDGRIQTGSFEGQDGKRVYTTEVVADSTQFLEPRNANADNRSGSGLGAPSYGAQQNEQPSYQNQQPSQQYQQPNQQNYTRTDDDPFSTGGGPIEVSDDDLPF